MRRKEFDPFKGREGSGKTGQYKQKKNHTIKEIWNILPKRLQGFLLMLIIVITIEFYQTMIDLLNLGVWSKLLSSIILIVYIFWVIIGLTMPWLSEVD